MVIELGHIALVLAMMAALAQCALPAIGAEKRWANFMRVGDAAALTQFALAGLAYLALTYAFVTTDLSVTLVYQHSSVDKPLAYKIAGVIGNHEGSMLLWALTLALFGALVAVFGRNLPLSLRARVLAVQGAVSLAFLAFIIFTSNPFLRWPDGLQEEYLRGLLAAQGHLPGGGALLPRLGFMDESALLDTVRRYGAAIPPPAVGNDLTPVLQDPALVLHPPMLYLGYVGLSIAYSFAVAALWEGRVDAAWARWVRPWTLFAWLTLTLGIALGSYWAYYELGWGGWWFWDPVENASLMPWLAATALLHSAIVVEKRGELKSWTVLLAIIGFSFSLFGTFLVRSDVLASVHAFASDPDRGLFLLAILVILTGGALALYAYRAKDLAASGLFAPVSRETALLVNNVLLAATLAMVLIGTMAPLVAQSFGDRLTVGPPFFNGLLAVFWAPLLALLPLGAATPWKRGDAVAVLKRFTPALLLAGVVAIVAVIAAPTDPAPELMDARGLGLPEGVEQEMAAERAPAWQGPALTALGVFLGGLLAAWAFFGALYEPLERARVAESVRSRAAFATFWRRLRATPLSLLGKTLAHGGLGLFALGAALAPAFETEDIRIANVGDRIAHGGLEFVVAAFDRVEGPNFVSTQAVVDVYNGDSLVATVRPEQRTFTLRNETTSEVGLHTGLWRDIYVVLGDRRPDGGWALHTRSRPFSSWIWFGMIAMSAGAVVSLLDRRLRVGAPSVRKAATAAGVALLLAFAAAPTPSLAAIQPEEQFSDPALEARARALFAELRCMTCDNQAIDDSNAPIAADIRAYVRQAILGGASDAEIRERLVVAYGEDILLSPPFWGGGFWVWTLSVAAFAAAATMAALRVRRRAGPDAPPPEDAALSEDEQRRLDELMRR